MIRLCSRFDSVLFTPKISEIPSYGNYSRSPCSILRKGPQEAGQHLNHDVVRALRDRRSEGSVARGWWTGLLILVASSICWRSQSSSEYCSWRGTTGFRARLSERFFVCEFFMRKRYHGMATLQRSSRFNLSFQPYCGPFRGAVSQ